MSFPAILVLEDGSIFDGIGFGIEKVEIGEIVFNTSMTGYQEIITDPSYKKQIITFTHPHIGNTGINDEDMESSKIHASGIVVKEFSNNPSNWRSKSTLEDFLIKQNIIAISDVDTRKLTNHLRENGSMGCCIAAKSKCSNEEAIQNAKNFEGLEGLDLAKEVSTQDSYKWEEGVWPEFKISSSKLNIVAYDFGIKRNILRLLAEHVGKVTVVNAQTSFDEVMAMKPDGIFLSNGPGDPEPCSYAIDNIKKFLEVNMPIFGICLGHQILALALGGETFKMHQGHHGANHPVKNLDNKKVEITSMNHGFAVKFDSLNKNIDETHISLFDGSNSGLSIKDKPIFSVQHHPEASPGPYDSLYLFNKFQSLVRNI